LGFGVGKPNLNQREKKIKVNLTWDVGAKFQGTKVSPTLDHTKGVPNMDGDKEKPALPTPRGEKRRGKEKRGWGPKEIVGEFRKRCFGFHRTPHQTPHTKNLWGGGGGGEKTNQSNRNCKKNHGRWGKHKLVPHFAKIPNGETGGYPKSLHRKNHHPRGGFGCPTTTMVGKKIKVGSKSWVFFFVVLLFWFWGNLWPSG